MIRTRIAFRNNANYLFIFINRNVHEWRTAEFKAKKQSHSACRENEKIQDMSIEARLGRGKTLSDKESVKVSYVLTNLK